MTERLLEKLTALDKCTEKVMDIRTQKCWMQNNSREKSLHIPLTFDFHTGFETPCPKSRESYQKEQSWVDGQKMDSKLTSGSNLWKPKLLTSELLPRKRLFGKANMRPYSVPDNLKYQLLGKNRYLFQKFGKIPDTTGILPRDGVKGRKRAIAQKDATSLGRSEWFSNIHPTGCDLGNETTDLIPLTVEEELNKPNTTVISPHHPKQEDSSPILSSTTPIIFHDTGYVQMFLLTRNRYYLKNKDKPISGNTNLVLKKNNEIIKTLISDPLTAAFWRKGALLDEGQIDAKTMPLGAENLIKEKTRKKTDSPSVQALGGDFLPHEVSPESEDLTPIPSSHFQYSSNARHSKYLQNFSSIRNAVRMTHLDNLLTRESPKIFQMDKAVPGIQDLRSKPQTPSTFKYTEKFPGPAFESKAPVRGTAEQTTNIRAEQKQASTFEKPLFLTSLDDTKNQMRETAAVPGPSSQSIIHISVTQ